jgi:GNAT superfamily N-acetyltransferase
MFSYLPPAQYPAVAPLFEPLHHHLALTALLAGAVPGRVFADHAATGALAWVQYRLFAAGDASGALSAALETEVAPRAHAAGIRHLALYAAPTALPALQAGLGDRVRPTGYRLYLERPATAAAAWRDRLPACYLVCPVDRALLARDDLENLDPLRAELCSERPSVEAFLRHSFGVCALRGGALAGWCLSEYNHAGACEVGIEVLEPHRRQGLATALTLALVERAAAAGLRRVGWHCYAGNLGSVATARAAGFDQIAEYPAWVVHIG